MHPRRPHSSAASDSKSDDKRKTLAAAPHKTKHKQPQHENAAHALSYLSSDETLQPSFTPPNQSSDERGVTRHVMTDVGEYTIHVKAPSSNQGRVEIQVHPRYTSPGSNKIQIRRNREVSTSLQGVMRWDLDTPADGDIVRIMHLCMICLMQHTGAKRLSILVDKERAAVHAQMGLRVVKNEDSELVSTLEMLNDGLLSDTVEPLVANTPRLKNCAKEIRQLFGDVTTIESK